MKRLVIVSCVVVLAVVLARRWGKYRSPTATFKAMLAAAEAGDRDALIACYDEEGQACYRELDRLHSEAMGGRDVSWPMRAALPQKGVVYGKEVFDGDTATLEVTKGRRTETVLFRKEGLAWKFHDPALRDVVEAMRRRNKEMGQNAGERKGMAKNMGAPHPMYDSPRSIFEALVEAAAAGDRNAILACCDRRTRTRLAKLYEAGSQSAGRKDPFMEMMASYKGGGTAFGREEVRGDTATLEVTENNLTRVMSFRREERKWRFSAR